jgi:flagellar M-ring protein FliF
VDSQTTQTGSNPDVRLSLGTSPEPAKGAVDRMTERFNAFTLNQKILVGAGALAIVAAIWLAFSSVRNPAEYRVLYSNLSESDGAAILAALEQQNVPFKFTEGGGAIMVPQEALYETRLKLAGQGLPKAANVGFELLDNQKFGTSQFVEQVNYVRALEGELARSVASLDQVKSARVHLAIPKQTAFVREREDPTASVVVELFPGRVLDDAQTAAITRLVSSSVPRLQPKNVSVVDTEGALLAPAPSRNNDGLDESQLRYTAELENALNRRLAELLEPIAGKEGFRAKVAVDLDFDERERTSETFGKNATPEGQAFRSRQTVEMQGGSTAPGGVPGALTNQPPMPPEAPIVNDVNTVGDEVGAQGRDLVAPGPVETGTAQTESPGFRRESTENFEVDRVIERLKASKGQVRRVSAAVVLDYKSVAQAEGQPPRRTPFSERELAEVTALVRDAVGYVEQRGDRVSVINLEFSAPPVEAAEPVLSSDLIADLIRYALIALAILFAYYTLIRPFLMPEPVKEELTKPTDDVLMAPATPPVNVTATQAEPQLGIVVDDAVQAEEDAAVESPSEGEARVEEKKLKRFEELLQYAEKFATEKPDETALLLRAWLNDKGRESA